MKRSILFTFLALATCLWTGCNDDEELPAMSRTSLKSYGPTFCEVQSRLYLTGGSDIKRSGACWVLKSTKEYDEKALEFATVEDNVQELPINNPDLYRMRIEGLQPDTVYYVRFFATNDEGTFYSYPVRVPTTKIYNDKVFVEMGKFMMGSAAGKVDEMPIHEVEFEHSFYISIYKSSFPYYLYRIRYNNINNSRTTCKSIITDNLNTFFYSIFSTRKSFIININ